DEIPAVLSPGEGVLVPEAVRLLGADWVRWINSVASGGRAGTPGPTPGYFANGGVVAKAEGSPSGSGESAGDVLSIDVGSLERLGEVAEAVTKAVQALAKTLAQLVQQVRSHWRAIEAATNSASNNITNRQQTLNRFLATTWQQIRTSIVNASNQIWNRQSQLQRQFQTSYNAIARNARSSVDGQRRALTDLSNAMASSRNAMRHTADWARSQYARIRAAAADPIRWTINNPFNRGIIAAWNKLNREFSFNKHVAGITPGFATGGYTGDGGMYEPK